MIPLLENKYASLSVAAVIGFIILAIIVVFVRLRINKEKRQKAVAQRAIRCGFGTNQQRFMRGHIDDEVTL